MQIALEHHDSENLHAKKLKSQIANTQGPRVLSWVTGSEEGCFTVSTYRRLCDDDKPATKLALRPSDSVRNSNKALDETDQGSNETKKEVKGFKEPTEC